MRTSHLQGVVEQGADTEHCPETAANEVSGFLNLTVYPVMTLVGLVAGSVHSILALATFQEAFTSVGGEGRSEVVKGSAVVPVLGAVKLEV